MIRRLIGAAAGAVLTVLATAPSPAAPQVGDPPRACDTQAAVQLDPADAMRPCTGHSRHPSAVTGLPGYADFYTDCWGVPGDEWWAHEKTVFGSANGHRERGAVITS
ncbi:hypothetical protein OHB41_38660 [Streptomyces sp. NBC_01571]|uniref:hypothetical protein n=1 Tax=Streptomyces sp. NBC_01571 TaxID=2975883 RepID=UPI0022593DBE|nr:hypothetical protein [Streptomyces sp. NBC_01571]MCX4579008.1 hypothetical protein [Streptomyces sp. NBC_01571]